MSLQQHETPNYPSPSQPQKEIVTPEPLSREQLLDIISLMQNIQWLKLARISPDQLTHTVEGISDVMEQMTIKEEQFTRKPSAPAFQDWQGI